MAKHWKVGLAIAVVTALTISLTVVFSPLVGVVAVLASVVAAWILGIAGMWPKGYEEHDEQGRREPEPRPKG